MPIAKVVRSLLDSVSEKIDKQILGRNNSSATPGALLNEEDSKEMQSKICKAYRLLLQATDYCLEQSKESKPNFGEEAHCALAFQYELFLYCAETSLKSNNLEVCCNTLNWFFFNYPNKIDEYYVRALFCKANFEVVFALRSHMKGEVLNTQIESSISLVLSALDICLQDKERLSFMIHEGALHFWNISRILNKPNLAHKLIPSFSKVSQALNDIDDSDISLRIQILVQMALCQDSCDTDVDGALKTVNQAVELAKRIETIELNDQITRIQMYISRRTQKKASDSKSPNVKFISVLQPLKSIHPNSIDREKIVKELQDLLTSLSTADAPKSSSSKKKEAPVQKKQKVVIDEGKLLLIADLGLICVSLYSTLQENALMEIATNAQELVQHAQSFQTRIVGDFIKSQLSIYSLGYKLSEKLTQSMLNCRLKGIRILEKALESCIRLDSQTSGDLIHIGCVLMWNSCLCMLQHNLRSYIRKPLTIVATLLSEIDSHQYNYLRVLIHLELANNDISDDVLTKAASNVKKALQLDYVADKDEQSIYNTIRPFDRLLVPMEEKLELKTNVYKIPEGKEDEAYLLIEQAKDSLDASVRATLLESAMNYLRTSDVDITDEKKKRRTDLWLSVVKVSWMGRKIIRTLREAASVVLKNVESYDVIKDRIILVKLAETCFMVSESYILELKDNHGLTLENRIDAEDYQTVMLHQNAVLEYIEKGISIGLFAKQPWLILNGCIMLWNSHLNLFQDHGLFLPYVKAFTSCFEALKSANIFIEVKDQKKGSWYNVVEHGAVSVLRQITYGYVVALLQTHLYGSNYTNQDLKASIINPYTVTPHGSIESLNKGLDALNFSIPILKSVSVYTAKECLRLKVSIQKLLSPKNSISITGDEQEQIILSVEALNQPSDVKEKSKIISELIPFLKGCSNIECFALLAQISLNNELYHQALEISSKGETLLSKNSAQDNLLCTPYQWRYFALNSLVAGQTIAKFIQPSKQNQTTQVTLRMKSLEKFVDAMLHATKSILDPQNSQIIISIAQNAFQVISPLFSVSAFDVIRQSLIVPLDSILKNSYSAAKSIPFNAEIFEKLYSFLFTCLLDSAEESLFLSTVKQALDHLPKRLHKVVWQFDIAFKSKNIADNKQVLKSSLNRLKGYDPETQAKILVMVGQQQTTFGNTSDNYFVQAIQISKSDVYLQAWCMTQYAVWLYCYGHVSDKSYVEHLLMAADLFIEIDEISLTEPEEEDVVQSDTMSAHTKASRKSQTSQKSNNSKTSSKKTKSSKSSGSRKSSKLKNLDPEPEQLHFMDIKQLNMLVSIYSLLAIFTDNDEKKIDYSVQAFYFVSRIWKLSVDFAQFIANSKGELLDIVFDYPINPEQWVCFQFPQAVLNIWKKGVDDTRMQKEKKYICASSIENPIQSLWYLSSLCNIYELYGMYEYCLPILYFKLIIAQNIICDTNLESCIYLEFAYVYECLDKPNLTSEYKSKANEHLLIQEHVKRLLREEHEIRYHTKKQAVVIDNRRAVSKIITSTRLKQRQIWNEKASLLFHFADYVSVNELLSETYSDCMACADNDMLASVLINMACLAEKQGKYEKALLSVQSSLNYTCTTEQFRKAMFLKFKLLFVTNTESWKQILSEYDTITNHIPEFVRYCEKTQLVYDIAKFLVAMQRNHDAIECLTIHLNQKMLILSNLKSVCLLLKLQVSALFETPLHNITLEQVESSLTTGLNHVRYVEAFCSSHVLCAVRNQYLTELYSFCSYLIIFKKRIQHNRIVNAIKEHTDMINAMSSEEKMVYDLKPDDSIPLKLILDEEYALLASSNNISSQESMYNRHLRAKTTFLIEYSEEAKKQLTILINDCLKFIKIDTLDTLKWMFHDLLIMQNSSEQHITVNILLSYQSLTNFCTLLHLFQSSCKTGSKESILLQNSLAVQEIPSLRKVLPISLTSDTDTLKQLPYDCAILQITLYDGNIRVSVLSNPIVELKKGDCKEDNSLIASRIYALSSDVALEDVILSLLDDNMCTAFTKICQTKKKIVILIDCNICINLSRIEAILMSTLSSPVDYVCREFCMVNIISKSESLKTLNYSKAIVAVTQQLAEQVQSLIAQPQNSSTCKLWKTYTLSSQDFPDISKVMRAVTSTNTDTELSIMIYLHELDFLDVISPSAICSLSFNKISTVVIFAPSKDMTKTASLLMVRGAQSVVFCSYKESLSTLDAMIKRIGQQKTQEPLAKILHEYCKTAGAEITIFGYT